MQLRSLLKNYRDFMTKPINPLPLGIFRFLFGGLTLISAFFLWPDLDTWFSDQGVLPTPLLKQMVGDNRLTIFRIFGSSSSVVHFIYAVHIAAAALLMLGLGSRIASVALFVTLTSFHHRNIYILHSGDTIMRLISFFLVFANSGAAFSLDRLWNIFRGADTVTPTKRIHPLAVRLMQLQLCIVYLATFSWKALGNMWIDGNAVFVVNQISQFERFPVPAFMKSVWASKALSWYTLLAEASFAFLVWFDETRIFMLIAMLILHAGLEYTMNIQLFQPIICSVFVLFLTESELRYVANLVQKPIRSWLNRYQIHVFYDGHCGFCKRCIAVFQTLDVFKMMTWIDGRLPELEIQYTNFPRTRAELELIILNHRGEWLGGFFAMRAVAMRLPLVSLLACLGYMPLFPLLGTLVYRQIANHRPQISSFFLRSGGRRFTSADDKNTF